MFRKLLSKKIATTLIAACIFTFSAVLPVAAQQTSILGWEIESNDAYEDANTFDVNTGYRQASGKINSHGDNDHYIFTLDKNSDVSFYFTQFSDTASRNAYYYYCVIDDVTGEEIFSGEIDYENRNQKNYFTGIGGHKYLIYVSGYGEIGAKYGFTIKRN